MFVAPPWGDAPDEATGLDLRATTPPLPEIVDLIADTFPRNRVLIAAQVYETVVSESVVAATSRCNWSARRTYAIDTAGQNHGLLLGTIGWTPGDKPR